MMLDKRMEQKMELIAMFLFGRTARLLTTWLKATEVLLMKDFYINIVFFYKVLNFVFFRIFLISLQISPLFDMRNIYRKVGMIKQVLLYRSSKYLDIEMLWRQRI
jgi:hypothetical protein